VSEIEPYPGEAQSVTQDLPVVAVRDDRDAATPAREVAVRPVTAQPAPAQPTYAQPTYAQPYATGHAGYGAPGQIMTDQRPVDGAVVAIAWVLAVVTFLYMLPWAVAASRGKANHGTIALINALLGWSFIGWVAALVMACQAHQVVGAPMTMNVVVAQHSGQPVPYPPAGWYASPDGVGRQYWDGQTWTGHRAP
jgi:hypothetical protein